MSHRWLKGENPKVLFLMHQNSICSLRLEALKARPVHVGHQHTQHWLRFLSFVYILCDRGSCSLNLQNYFWKEAQFIKPATQYFFKGRGRQSGLLQFIWPS